MCKLTLRNEAKKRTVTEQFQRKELEIAVFIYQCCKVFLNVQSLEKNVEAERRICQAKYYLENLNFDGSLHYDSQPAY